MDPSTRKRSRDSDPTTQRGTKKIETAAPPVAATDLDGEDQRPTSIFEFPWQKEKNYLVIESDHGCDLRDIFFSSLVDGCRAAIGFPGDRLSPSPAPISLPDEADGGGDCIWSCVLREPLSLRCVR